jgi:tetratricopeptide (TPR) repeat protein
VDSNTQEKVPCADPLQEVRIGRGRLRSLWQATAAFLLIAGVVIPLPAQQSRAGYERTILSIQQLIQNGDLSSAKTQLTVAGRQFPADGGLENLQGVVEIQQGRTDEAIQSFSQAIRHSPKLTGAYLNLGRVYMQSIGKEPSAPVKALDVYERALVIAPANAEANYQVAKLWMLKHNYQRSLEHLDKLDRTARGKTGALTVECADQAGLAHRAEVERTAATLAGHPELTEADAMEVLPALQSAHRADLAVLILAAAAERGPLSPAGLRNLGLAQESAGELREARNTLERAFAADTKSTAVLMDLARVARAAKDYQGALGYLAHARDLQPADASLPYYFGLVSLELNLLGESRKAFGEAVRLAPDNPDYNFAMGVVSSFAQDPTLALPYLQKYHALRPIDPAGVLALGTTYFRAKDFETAVPWLKQALLSAKTAGTAHYYLGRVARQQGRLDDAAAELSRAIAIKADQPDVLSEMGQVYVQMRKYPEAESKFNEAIVLNPDNYAANFGLLQLYARTGDSRREEQAKRFDQLQSKSQAQYQEMMRIIEIRPQE